jgi:hypothetical protein
VVLVPVTVEVVALRILIVLVPVTVWLVTLLDDAVESGKQLVSVGPQAPDGSVPGSRVCPTVKGMARGAA